MEVGEIQIGNRLRPQILKFDLAGAIKNRFSSSLYLSSSNTTHKHSRIRNVFQFECPDQGQDTPRHTTGTLHFR